MKKTSNLCITNLKCDKLIYITSKMRKGSKYFIVLNEIDSTNNYANHLIVAGQAIHGTAVLAHYQQQGRGQQGNQWESAPGLNMLASFIFMPDFLPPERQFYLSKIASLALTDWLSQHVDHVKVKWPNDIYVGDRKIAGMLIETSVMGNNLQSAVAGIGLNLNQLNFSPSLPNPVSLKQLTGIDYNVEEVALQFWDLLMEWYLKLEQDRTVLIDEAYVNNLYRMNMWAEYIKDKQSIEARIAGVDAWGQLILEKRSGERIICAFKEITFVI
jgi:BirA family transcriptional regulator, biotin operon repressor / biotin---[acetyl-CoA-carboxylase] ligase